MRVGVAYHRCWWFNCRKTISDEIQVREFLKKVHRTWGVETHVSRPCVVVGYFVGGGGTFDASW